MPPDNPTRLPDARQPVGTHARFSKRRRKFGPQKLHGPVGLILAFQARLRRTKRIHRILDVRHVHYRRRAPRKTHREPIPADHPVLRPALPNALRHLGAAGLMRLIEILDHDHLRSVNHAFGRLAAFQARAPHHRRVARGIHESIRPHHHIAIARGTIPAP